MPLARSGIANAITNATPDWLLTTPSGQWVQVPGGSLLASGVREDFGADLGVFAYSNYVVNTKGLFVGGTFIAGTFLIFFGGGHGNYSGNEYYAFGPLERAVPQWYKPRARTSPAPINVAEDGSGNPVSRHTYMGTVYDGSGSNNRMLCIGIGARHDDAGAGTTLHCLDFTVANPDTNLPWSKLADCSTTGADAAAVDPVLGRVWYHPQTNNVVAYYDIAANTHASASSKSPPWTLQSIGTAFDERRQIWAVHHTTGVAFYDARNGVANDYYTPTITGTAPSGPFGIIRDPVRDCFVAWSGSGKQIFYLTPPSSSPYAGGNAWVWSSVTPGAGATPDAAATTSAASRFAYVSTNAVRGYVLLNSQSSSAYLFKP